MNSMKYRANIGLTDLYLNMEREDFRNVKDSNGYWIYESDVVDLMLERMIAEDPNLTGLRYNILHNRAFTVVFDWS